MKMLIRQITTTVLVFAVLSSFAQGKFIEEYDFGGKDLSKESQSQLESLGNSKFYKKITKVKVGKFKDIQKNGEIIFTVPGFSDPITARALYVNSIDDSNYDWHGEIFDKSDLIIGYMNLNVEKEALSGLISVGDVEYQIMNLDKNDDSLPNYALLLDVDTKLMNSSTCETKEERQSKAKISNRNNSCNLANVRILVLYTQKAEDTGISPSYAANMGKMHLENGLGNSQIGQAATFTIAGIEKHNSFNETNDILYDLNLFTNSASQLRQNYYADLVILLTDGDYNVTLNNPVAGKASSVNSAANPSDAFAIVEIEFAVSGTFAHETGHLLGCGHQDGFDPPSGSNRAHTWTQFMNGSTVNRKTITSAPSTGSIAYFSNPAVSINGLPTGLVNANNAAQVNQNICPVSLFSEATTSFNVFVTGPSYISNSNTSYSWCPLSSGCSSLSQYFWSYSTDGFSYTAFGSSNCGTKTGNTFPAHYRVFIKLTAQCADNGFWASDVKTVTNWSYNYLINENVEERSNAQTNNSSANINEITATVSPNPTSKNLNIKLFIPNSQMITADFVDLAGMVKQTWNLGYLEKGENDVNLETKDFQDGNYFLVIKGNSKMSVQQIIIKR